MQGAAIDNGSSLVDVDPSIAHYNPGKWQDEEHCN